MSPKYFTSVIQQWKQSLKAGSALEKPEGMCMAFFHFFFKCSYFIFIFSLIFVFF